MPGHRKLLVISALALGCAAAPRARPAPRNIEVKAPEPEQTSQLMPAPEPPGLVLVARVQDPRRWLRLESTPPLAVQLLRDELPEGVLEHLDFSQPVEFALGWQEPPAAELSSEGCEDDCPPIPAPLSGFYAGVSAGLREWNPAGLERVGFTRSGGQSLARGSCIAARALGSAPARLICSDTREAVRKVDAYLARGLPLQELGPAPAVARLEPRALRDAWARERGKVSGSLEMLTHLDPASWPAGSATPDPSLQATLLETARSLLAEVDTFAASVEAVSLELSPTSDDGLELVLSLITRDPQPWTMSALARSSAAGAELPAHFERLPPGADSAGYTHGLDASDAAVITEGLRNLWPLAPAVLMGFHGGPGPRRMDELKEHADAVLSSQCLVTGRDVWATYPYAPPSGAPTIDTRLREAVGHRLVGTLAEGRCGELVRSRLERLIASRDFAQSLKDIHPGLRLRQVHAPARLGAKAAVYQLDLPPSALGDLRLLQALQWATKLVLFNLHDIELAETMKHARLSGHGEARRPLSLTLAVVSAGGAEWIGLSAAPDELYRVMQLLAGARGAAPPRADLARLRAQGLLAGEYFTLASLSELDELPDGLGAALRELAGADALNARVLSTTSVSRDARRLKGRLDYYVPPVAVAALRRLAVIEPSRLEAVRREHAGGGAAQDDEDSEE